MADEERTLDQQVQYARRAEALLNDEVFQNAVKRTESRLQSAWRNSGTGDVAVREQAYFLLRALAEVQNEIRKDIDGGKVAEAKVVQIRRQNNTKR